MTRSSGPPARPSLTGASDCTTPTWPNWRTCRTVHRSISSPVSWTGRPDQQDSARTEIDVIKEASGSNGRRVRFSIFATGPQGARYSLGGGQELQNFADGLVPAGGLLQGKVSLDLVSIPATLLEFHHVSAFRQVRDDSEGPALRDVEGGCDVPEAHVGIAGDAQQCPTVIGQKVPGRHGAILVTPEY